MGRFTRIFCCGDADPDVDDLSRELGLADTLTSHIRLSTKAIGSQDVVPASRKAVGVNLDKLPHFSDHAPSDTCRVCTEWQRTWFGSLEDIRNAANGNGLSCNWCALRVLAIEKAFEMLITGDTLSGRFGLSVVIVQD